MFSNIGVPGMILIVVIALIIFGPSKLPELGKAFGKTLREFKDATKGLVDDDDKGTTSRTEVKKIEQPVVTAETKPAQDAVVVTATETVTKVDETVNKSAAAN